MRLLYVIDSLAPGGAETSLAEMAPGLVASGIDLHVLSLGARHDLEGILLTGGASVHHSAAGPGRRGNVAAVRSVARSIRPDLIHTTLFESDIAGRVAAATLGIPSSTSLVNDSYGESHYGESRRLRLHGARALDSLTARTAVRFHAITRAIADRVGARLWIPGRRIQVIPRGRDPLRLPFRDADMRSRVRSELAIAPATRVVLNVGRLEPQKGQHHLLLAAARMKTKYPDMVVLIAGKDGRSSGPLRALAHDLALDARFLGHRQDVPALLAAADAFCFPSEREGFGGVLIEAMATGCPIIASDIPTSREVLAIGSQRLGLLTSTQPDELADAITAALDDDDATLDRVVLARQHFLSSFDLASVTDAMALFFVESASA